MNEVTEGAGKGRPSTVRLEAFSDGVIAIVATIMVLELQAPAQTFMSGDFWTVFEELGPDIAVYALSFVMVAILLVNHHFIIRAASYASTALYWWNSNFLFWMALIPLSTSVYGKHPLTPLAVAFYGLIMAANTGALLLLRRCTHQMGDAPPTSAAARTARFFTGKDAVFTALYALSVPIAFLSEWVPMAIFLIVPMAYVLPNFGAGSRPAD